MPRKVTTLPRGGYCDGEGFGDTRIALKACDHRLLKAWVGEHRCSFHDVVQQPAAAVESFEVPLTACRRSGMAGCLESDVDDTAIPCRERSYVRRRRVFSIERGEVGRERELTCLGVRVAKCLPAHRDQAGRGAPHSNRFAAGACLWRAGPEHL